jgi:hypothetical protein
MTLHRRSTFPTYPFTSITAGLTKCVVVKQLEKEHGR